MYCLKFLVQSSNKKNVYGSLSNWFMQSYNFSQTLDFQNLLKKGFIFQRVKYVFFTKIFRQTQQKYFYRLNFKYKKPSVVFVFESDEVNSFLRESNKYAIPSVLFTSTPPSLISKNQPQATYTVFFGNFSSISLHVFFSYFFSLNNGYFFF